MPDTVPIIIIILIGIITITVMVLYLWKLAICNGSVVKVKVKVEVTVGTIIIPTSSTTVTNVMAVVIRASMQVGHHLILACIAAAIIGTRIAAINSSIAA